MNKELHEKYDQVQFTRQEVNMMIDIINLDPLLRKTFDYISRTLLLQKKEQNNDKKVIDGVSGVTINDIVKNVKIERRVKKQKGKMIKFEKEIGYIDRKAAEKCVDKLLAMSLLYYELITPYKFLFMTNRGLQVMAVMLENERKEKKGEK